MLYLSLHQLWRGVVLLHLLALIVHYLLITLLQLLFAVVDLVKRLRSEYLVLLSSLITLLAFLIAPSFCCRMLLLFPNS